MITRADISGALKVLNATNTKNRRAAIETMMLKEHTALQVARALDDLPSYPDWQARLDLETVISSGAEGAVSAIPDVPKKSKKDK